MDFSAGSLFLNLIISGIGSVLLIYGKKQGRVPQMIAGVVYLVYPYFIDDVWTLFAIGAAVAAGLWWAVRQGY